METTMLKLLKKDIKTFKIDLIVWKLTIKEKNYKINKCFKIDLIVWKHSNCKGNCHLDFSSLK